MFDDILGKTTVIASVFINFHVAVIDATFDVWL